MRLALVVAALSALLGGGCSTRARPYRFASPMLGTAEIARAPLHGPAPARAPRPELANREARAIRVVSAPQIREASAAAADAVVAQPSAQADARASLPAPNQLPTGTPLPAIREAPDLRSLVGRRTKEDPTLVVLDWTRALGRTVEGTTGGDLVGWAASSNRLADATEVAAPGDLLIFDHVTSDTESDLVALVIDRDARGVTEYLYVGNGVVRRGFVDPTRPATKRDAQGVVVNTYLRHGRRWPAKGTHYLAGELLARVVYTR